MVALGRDLKHATRTLLKSPLFALIAVLVLGLAIAANLTAFTWVNALFLRPLPVDRPDELMQVWTTDASGQLQGTFLAAIKVLRTEPSLSGTCGFFEIENAAEIGGGLRTVAGEAMTSDCFEALGLKTQLGRFYTQAEDLRTPDRVAVLSDQLWRAAFAADPTILGKQVRYGGTLYTIIGVMEPRFTGLNPGSSTGLIVPGSQFPLSPEQPLAGTIYSWGSFFVRRAPGVSFEQARAALTALGPRMLDEGAPGFFNPEQRRAYAERKVAAAPVGSSSNGAWLNRRFSAPLYALWGVGVLVLGVACVSVAALLLARGVTRTKEVGVRLALGASRAAVFRLLALEAVLLVAGAAAFGVALAGAANRFVAARASDTFDLTFDTGLDFRAVLLLVLLVVAVFALFAGAIAWQVRRFGRATLSQSSRGARGGSIRSQKLLLGAQVALTLALVCVGGVLAASARNLYELDLGIRTNDLAFARLSPNPAPGGRQPDGQYFAELRDRVLAVPGVTGAGYSTVAPFWTFTYPQRTALLESDVSAVDAVTIAVDDAALGLLRIPILAGQGFGVFGSASQEPTAIVTRSLADRFGGDSVIGRYIGIEEGAPTTRRMRVVGVSGNAKFGTASPEAREPPTVFVNFWEQPRPSAFAALVIETAPGVSVNGNTISAVVQSLDRQYVLAFRTLERAKSDALVEDSALAVVSGGFGMFALVLAAAGLFGLLSYHVTTRVPEIGVRMALGAEAPDVAWLVVREILPVVVVGAAVGLALAFAAGMTLGSVVYGIGAHDPAVLTGSVLVLLLTSALAAWVPTRRAARVDPMEALRAE
jgi:putative ABC transport system permease protein